MSFPKTLRERYRKIIVTAQKTKFSIKDFFSKCDQIRSKLRVWSHLMKKSLTENFILCAVSNSTFDSVLKLLIIGNEYILIQPRINFHSDNTNIPNLQGL